MILFDSLTIECPDEQVLKKFQFNQVKGEDAGNLVWYTFTCCDARKSRTVTFETPKYTYDFRVNFLETLSKQYLDAMDLNALGALDFQFHSEGTYTPNDSKGFRMIKNYEINIKANAVVLEGESSPSFPRMCSSSSSSNRKNGNTAKNEMELKSKVYLGKMVYYI